MILLIIVISGVLMAIVHVTTEAKENKKAQRVQQAFYNAQQERQHDETEKELSYLEIRMERLTQLGSDLELEYERTTDHKKRQRLMKQILTTDQQAYTTQRKIDKLTGY